MELFDLDMIKAKCVIFKKPIFEDDFPEKGMMAYLTDIVKSPDNNCYKLYFDFTEFERDNYKYFKADYYDSNGQPCLTAIEAGLYSPKYSVYFGDMEWTQEKLEEELKKHIM